MNFDEKLKVAMAYPDETEGSRLAAEARRLSNPLSREERRRLFREAMVMIHGGVPVGSQRDKASQPETESYAVGMTFEEKLKVAMTYPEETEGSRLAAKARQMANGLGREERKRLFRKAMVRIYGGQLPEETCARQ